MKDSITFVHPGKEYPEIGVFRPECLPGPGWELICVVSETSVSQVDMEIPVWNPNGAYISTQMLKRPAETSVPLLVMGRMEKGAIEALVKSKDELITKTAKFAIEIEILKKSCDKANARVRELEDALKGETAALVEQRKYANELRKLHDRLASSMTLLRDRLGKVRMDELLNPDAPESKK